MQRPEHPDEVTAEAVLEGHAPGVDPARHEQDILVLDVDALDLADALREVEDLRLAERRSGEPAHAFLPDHRWVETLLDGGPDREARREDLLAIVVPNHQVGS